MTIPWPEIATAWAVFAGNILTPGPNVFNTVAIALGAGRGVALAVVPAIALGVLGWSSAAVLGAAVLFRKVPALEPALTALGGALLLWFGLRYLRRARHWAGAIGGAPVTGARGAFASTLAILATNPKALTTWLVLVSIFPAGRATPEAVAVMIVGSVALASLGHLAYALAFSTRAAAEAYARAGRWVTGGVGLAFLALGLSLLAEAARVAGG
jgi:threonine/homoserine/homoserine lactone efflux protein